MPVPVFQNLAAKVRSKTASLVREILNGRPMIYQRTVFTDPESGFEVCEYLDQCGRKWHASSRWGLIRVPAE